MRSPSPEEEGVAETTYDELTTNLPHSLSPCAAQSEKVENSGVKSSPGIREGYVKVVLRFSFYFSLPYSDFIGNKLN